MDTCMNCFARKPTEAYILPHVKVCNACKYKLNASVNFLSFYGVEMHSSVEAFTGEIQAPENGAQTSQEPVTSKKKPD